MSEIEKAIEYVREHIDMERVDIARGYMYLHRTPLHIEDAELGDIIYDLMEEYGQDNDLPENWWYDDTDEDEIIQEL